jgi:hypothetical protein
MLDESSNEVVKAAGLLSGPGTSSATSNNGGAAALPPGKNLFAASAPAPASPESTLETGENTDSGSDRKKKNVTAESGK